MLDAPTNTAWWALRLTYGLVPIVAGLDKFTNLLADWAQYLSPVAVQALPVSATTFMYVVGIIEVIAGLLVLVPQTMRIGAYVVSAWLLAIAANLVLARFYDIAVRDAVMAIGAFALAKLTEARQHAPELTERRPYGWTSARAGT
jgi:uncharacterized membrane protein YphA (DoxX/SURF4 family)